MGSMDPMPPVFADPARGRPRLVRPGNRVIGGVSAGLALHLGWPLGVVRWAFVLLALAGPGGFLYLWLWATVPSARELTAPAGEDALGWALRPWRRYIERRTRSAREEQRAEIAAHLHDSVLQTLALIQNRADSGSDVARIARAQERELREWLYAGADPAGAELGSELREVASTLELAHAVRFDVVIVGSVPDWAGGELASAAREAMLNAARHAGGEVSVYVEGAADAVDVFVRDRGPGFVPDAVPEDRLGVRESIVGRMRRAGGSAAVTSRPGGTEVHLRIERTPSEQEART